MVLLSKPRIIHASKPVTQPSQQQATHPPAVRASQSLRGCVAYCVAKELSQLPFQTLAPLLAAVAAKLVLRLQLHLQTAFVALALLMWCASGVGYVVSIALDKVRPPPRAIARPAWYLPSFRPAR